jgi:hypothetical protein
LGAAPLDAEAAVDAASPTTRAVPERAPDRSEAQNAVAHAFRRFEGSGKTAHARQGYEQRDSLRWHPFLAVSAAPADASDHSIE